MFYGSVGALEARECWRSLVKCFHPVGEAYREKSNLEIVGMVKNTDFNETCGYVDVVERLIM